MNIIIKLFINKGYIYYAIFNTFFSIFLNRKFIRFIKKMLKVIRVWCFFLTCIAIYWPFPEKKKKMNSLTSRKIVAVGQGHVLSTNLSFLLKTLLFTRLFRPHFSYSIFHSIPFKDHSKVTAIVIEFIFKPNISILFYDLIILSPFRSNILVATHTLCLSWDTIRINALIKNWKRKQQ